MKEATNYADRPIGDIVADNYHAAGVFREYGIDFCCGGGKNLSEVCEKKELNLKEISVKLDTINLNMTENSENYSDWSIPFLIEYIENTHHNFVRRKTNEIYAYAAKVARVHGERHPENIEIYKTFRKLTEELLDHLKSEEETVFPFINRINGKKDEGEPVTVDELQDLKSLLDEMEDEHEGAGALMASIRKLSNDYIPPAEACTTYRILYQNLQGFEEDLHKHVHLENNILFRKAKEFLSQAS